MLRDSQIIPLARVVSRARKEALEKRKATREAAERQRDEAVVQMLADRMEHGSNWVAAMHGFSGEYVRIATQRVLKDDLQFSGEPADVVLAAYPWSRKCGA